MGHSFMFTIGVVPYLNALPLYRTLETGQDEVRIVREVPSKLAPQLAAGECDVALIPVVEHFRGVGGHLISDACIASNGTVRSVLLFHRMPLRLVQTVAVDTSSRTSVALLRVILEDAHGLHPQFVQHAPALPAMLEECDAALLIGDAALEAREHTPGSGITVLDLGKAWTRMTDKPFVYAAWITRPGLEDERSRELEALLQTARDAGTASIDAIVRDNPLGTGMADEDVDYYLRFSIEYKLTAEHRAGLDEFRRRCASHGLLQH